MSLLLIGFSQSFASSFAQEETLVKVTPFLSKDKIRPGDTFKVAFRVSIAPGYHINANELTDPYLLPIELILEEQPGLESEEYFFPASRSVKFSFSESELPVYEGEIVLGVLIRAAKGLSAGSHTLKGKLIYQACNSVTCLPPGEIPVEIPLGIVPTPTKTKDINQDVFANLKFKKEAKQAP
jgi:DsbC/DsbD-like thiol-disulfide interchange protein